MPARVTKVALRNDLFIFYEWLSLAYYIVYDHAYCLSTESQLYQIVRCNILNRLLVQPYDLRSAELPQDYDRNKASYEDFFHFSKYLSKIGKIFYDISHDFLPIVKIEMF